MVDRFIAASAELRATLGQLARVTYLGEFPHFLKFIIDRLPEATKQVRISCDALLYGHFSAHDLFERYRDALTNIRKNSNVAANLIVLDEAGARKMRVMQFGDDTDDAAAAKSWARSSRTRLSLTTSNHSGCVRAEHEEPE